MADLSSSIRLAVDSGKVVFGVKEVAASIRKSDAKLVVVSKKGRSSDISDITHIAKIASIKVIPFDGNPIELGAVCGKPFSVSTLAIIDPGNSTILEENK